MAADQEADTGHRTELIKMATAWLEVAVKSAINDQGKSAISAQLRDLVAAAHARRLAPILRLVK